MMRSLFSGISGLKSHQTKMDVIGNNISNVNTTGFKSSRVVFADMLSQQLSGSSAPKGNVGGTNEKAIGLGTGVGAIDLLFTDGSVQSTGKNTDLALSGDGLFIVKQGNETYYTRNGDFSFDADGNYVMSGNGMYVQGWTDQRNARNEEISMSDDKTVASINTNGDPGIINIKAGKTMPPAVTTMADYTGNLNAATPGGQTITTTITVYDDQGYAYAVPVMFQKIVANGSASSVTANTWSMGFIDPKVPGTTASINVSGTTQVVSVVGTAVNIYDPNWDGTIAPGSTLSDYVIATVSMPSVAILEFSQSGQLISPSSTSMPTVLLTPVALRNSAVNPTTTGTSHVNFEVNVSNLTQYANESTLYGDTNGWASGVLKSVSFDSSGLITGVYTNGVRQYEGQVAIAQFANSAGLTKAGNSLYQASDNSGSANVKTATALGVTITASALELSNVDIATEFAEMITTQRGFQSNSKIVTVGDEMLETVINMKR